MTSFNRFCIKRLQLLNKLYFLCYFKEFSGKVYYKQMFVFSILMLIICAKECDKLRHLFVKLFPTKNLQIN